MRPSLIIMAMLLTLSSIASAEKLTGQEKLIAKVDAMHVPQMMALAGINNGSCIEGLSFSAERISLAQNSIHKQINDQLKNLGATC